MSIKATQCTARIEAVWWCRVTNGLFVTNTVTENLLTLLQEADLGPGLNQGPGPGPGPGPVLAVGLLKSGEISGVKWDTSTKVMCTGQQDVLPKRRQPLLESSAPGA